jgi:hypothetical protein|tara:strand:+ start:142 stop:531 length:390 start_codon:yes stop_codon:yes gene_type:complete
MYHTRELLCIIVLSILYIIFTMIAAHFIDSLFLNPSEDIKNTNRITLFIEIVLQTLSCVIAIFYIRKIIKYISIFFTKRIKKDYTNIYSGEIVISIVFIATQDNLLKKINHLVSKHDVFNRKNNFINKI